MKGGDFKWALVECLEGTSVSIGLSSYRLFRKLQRLKDYRVHLNEKKIRIL